MHEYLRLEFRTGVHAMTDHVLSLSDTITVSDTVVDAHTCGLGYITITYSGGVVCLHKPYPNDANGALSFSGQNFNFRSGHYASYIDEISDEGFTLSGYEDDSAMAKFVELGGVADDGLEVTITGLHDEYNGVYIIQSISYNPIGLDVFDYSISLRFVRELP
jgi:hypothetical protein